MENIATSVRITAAANALLSALAGKIGKPKAQIVEEALRGWDDKMFWTEVQQAFAASPESEELRTERELWDRTVSDGLAPVESQPFRSKPLRSSN
jgi:hypothetical protein